MIHRLSAFGLAILLAAIAAFALRPVCTPTPSESPRQAAAAYEHPSAPLHMRDVRRLRLGMTLAEAQEILGSAGQQGIRNDARGALTWNWYAGPGLMPQVLLHFQDGQLIEVFPVGLSEDD